MTPSPYGSPSPAWAVRVPPNETETQKATTMNDTPTRPCGGIIRAPTGAAMDEEFPVLLDTTEPGTYWLYIDLSEYNIAIAAGCCDTEERESDVCGGPSYTELLTAIAPYLRTPYDMLAYPMPDDMPYTDLEPAHDGGAPIEGGYRVTARGLEISVVKTGPWPVTVTTRMPIPEILTAIAAMVAREQEDA